MIRLLQYSKGFLYLGGFDATQPKITLKMAHLIFSREALLEMSEDQLRLLGSHYALSRASILDKEALVPLLIKCQQDDSAISDPLTGIPKDSVINKIYYSTEIIKHISPEAFAKMTDYSIDHIAGQAGIRIYNKSRAVKIQEIKDFQLKPQTIPKASTKGGFFSQFKAKSKKIVSEQPIEPFKKTTSDLGTQTPKGQNWIRVPESLPTNSVVNLANVKSALARDNASPSPKNGPGFKQEKPTTDLQFYFLSYSRKDADFAKKFADNLKSKGLKIWMDQIDIPPGANWDDTIEKAINDCTEIIFLASATSVASDHVKDELSFARLKGKKIVPVIISFCELPMRLHRAQFVDISVNYENGLTQIIQLLGK